MTRNGPRAGREARPLSREVRQRGTEINHGELFSAGVKAGSRTYFIDVQRAVKLWNLFASDLVEIQRSLKELTE